MTSESDQGRLKTVFKSCKLLTSLSDRDIDHLVENVNQVHFRDGDVIIRQGEEGNIFFIITSGCVDIGKQNQHEPQQQKVASLGQGDHFGELALLNDTTRSATVTARGDDVSCVTLTKEQFLDAVNPVSHLQVHREEDSGPSNEDIEKWNSFEREKRRQSFKKATKSHSRTRSPKRGSIDASRHALDQLFASK